MQSFRQWQCRAALMTSRSYKPGTGKPNRAHAVSGDEMRIADDAVQNSEAGKITIKRDVPVKTGRPVPGSRLRLGLRVPNR